MSGFDEKSLLLKLQGDSEEAINYLVKASKTDLNYVHPDTGNSLLILAAKQKQREVCEFLLSKGVDASVKNKDGLTAADVCSDAVMKRLLQAVITREKNTELSITSTTSQNQPTRELTSPNNRRNKNGTGAGKTNMFRTPSSPSSLQSPPLELNYDPTTPSRHFPVSHVNNTDSVLRKSKIRDYLKAKVREAQKDNEDLEELHTKAFSRRTSSYIIDSNDEEGGDIEQAQKDLRFNDFVFDQPMEKDKKTLDVKITENEGKISSSEGHTDQDGMISSSSAPSSPECSSLRKNVTTNSSHKTLPVRSITKQKKYLSSSLTATTTTTTTSRAYTQSTEIKKVVNEIDDMIAQRRAELKKRLAFFPEVNLDETKIYAHRMVPSPSPIRVRKEKLSVFKIQDKPLNMTTTATSPYLNTSCSTSSDSSRSFNTPISRKTIHQTNARKSKEKSTKILLLLSSLIILLQLFQVFEIHQQFKNFIFPIALTNVPEVKSTPMSIWNRFNILDFYNDNKEKWSTSIIRMKGKKVDKDKKKENNMVFIDAFSPQTQTSTLHSQQNKKNGKKHHQFKNTIKWIDKKFDVFMKSGGRIQTVLKRQKVLVNSFFSSFSSFLKSLPEPIKKVGTVAKKVMVMDIPAPLVLGVMMAMHVLNPSYYFYKIHTSKLEHVIRMMCY